MTAFLALAGAAVSFLPVPAHAEAEFSGETYLEPYRSIELTSVETGIIDQIYVKEGEFVEKDQPLIKLDSKVIEAQYAVAQARAESKGRIMAAQAERDQQQHRYDMLKSLRSRGASNSAELKKEFAMLQSAEGNLIAAQEDVRISQLEAVRIQADIDRRVIHSTIAGFVATITKDIGEPVGFSRSDPNEANFLVRVVQLATLKATAFLPYRAVKDVEVGDTLTLVSSDSAEEWQTEATVEFVSPLINPATGTVEIRVTVDNPDLKYKSGAPARLIVKVPVTLSSKK